MRNSIFVTGTDTGVGKTVVSAILARQLHARYWKPVQCGLDPETDSQFVSKHIGEERVAPSAFTLSLPTSPHWAASREGLHVSVAEIKSRRPKGQGPWIIEGAGGTLVPLNDRESIVDLIRALDCPALVVARTTLGTINHTLLTLEALDRRGIPVLGVVFVGGESPSDLSIIETKSKVPCLGHVPRLESVSPVDLATVSLPDFPREIST